MHDESSPVKEALKGSVPRQALKSQVIKGVEAKCVELSESENKDTVSINTNNCSSERRSRRQIKRTEKFNQYLRDQDAQSENIQNDAERKRPRNDTIQIKIRILDNVEGVVRNETGELDSSSCVNYEIELNDKQITELEKAVSRPENVNEVQDTNVETNEVNTNAGASNSETSEVNAKLEAPDEIPITMNKTRKRTRKSNDTMGNTPVRSKKKQTLLVSLKDYPDSYSIEEYISSDPVDKGKSVEDKTCQRYLCKLCNAYRTVCENQMEKHITLHVNKQLDCIHCGSVFNSRHNLSQHVREEHHETAFFICEHCGADFSEKRLYQKHLSNVHKQAAFTCTICQQLFHTHQEYKQHRLNDHENAAFKCNDCDSIFVSESTLERHRENKVCEGRLFACQECGRIKKSQAILDDHVRKIHSKEHCFKCNLCTYSTGQQYLLKHHMRAHLGIHPHKCDQCNFSCVKKWQLVSHMRTHSGEKKYKCQKCNYAAAWNVQVKNHMQAHESDAKDICKQCNIVFRDIKALRTHSWKEHGESRRKKSDMTIQRPNFRHENISLIAGTNLAVYNSKNEVKPSVQALCYTAPKLICIHKGEESSDSNEGETEGETLATNDEIIIDPIYPQHSSLVDGNESTVHENHSFRPISSDKTNSHDQDENFNIFYEADNEPEAGNLSSDKSTRAISLLNNSAISACSGAVVGGMSDSFKGCGEPQATNKTHTSTQSEMQELGDRGRSIISNKIHGSENKVIIAFADSTSVHEIMNKDTTLGESENSQKTWSSTSKLKGPKARFNIPLVNNKKVTLLRMHANPDGSPRFETVDSDEIYPAETSPSMITVSAQEVHNYAVPIHKRVKKTA